jgi:penicillin-binding protein 1A
MAKSERKKSRPPFRFWPFAFKWGLTFCLWGIAGGLFLIAWYAHDLPNVEQALSPVRRPSITVLAADGSEIRTFGESYRGPIRLDEMPKALPAAVLATEDRRFYDHFGVDVIGLARALLTDIRAGRIVQGGSTISQQAAKNLFLSPERSLKRKIQEFMLAVWLEHRFTKDQILTIYLNRVYLGAGTYGVEAASWRYFDKSARDLNTYESAMLAGLLKAPSRYSPASNPDLATQRTLQVLDNMVDAGYLTEAQSETAKRQRQVAMRGVEPLHFARHFTDWVVDNLPGYVPVGSQDLVVTTTLDKRLQRVAEDQVDAVMDANSARAGASEAAMVTLSPDGAVQAMVGGRDYARSQFNRATQAKRQPGSSFKLFVYLAAMEQGFTPQSRVVDAPVQIDGWSPGNFDGKFHGEVSLLDAFSESLNTAAVRVAQRVGPDKVVAVAQRFGITSQLLPSPSLALGTSEVDLLEMTAAYGAFANGGLGVWPYAIKEIRDRQGNLLYQRQGSGPGRVVDPVVYQEMTDMMSEVMLHGTGKSARLDRPSAGKTGTSQNFRDAWFIGYTADYVTGVWMGNDDNAPMRRVSGGSLPANLWKRFMVAAEQGQPIRQLPGAAPEGVVPGLVASQDNPSGEGFWARFLAPILGSPSASSAPSPGVFPGKPLARPPGSRD